MRVTNNMMSMNMLLNLNKNLAKMSKKQDELATGKRIHSPSDDPVLASKILARRTDLAELNQYSVNTRDALGWMEITEQALEDNGTVMQRIRELTVQAANGTNTAEDTQKIKVEVESMRDQLIANGNSTFAGRYIFSGFETNQKLLKEDGTFNIDVNQYSLDNKPVVKYEIGVGQSIDVMTSGLDIYGTVPENNVMTSSFPVGSSNDGIASTKEKLVGTFDLAGTYPANDLDVTINGTTYNMPALDGSVTPLTKTNVLDAYNTALAGAANVYFDANDQLAIESSSYGQGVPADVAQASATFTTSLTTGVETVEASVNNGGSTFVDPISAADLDALKNNDISVIVNGVSRKVRPDPSASITDVATYLAEMNTRLDLAFGSDIVDITAPAGVLTFTSKNANDSVAPKITVDFPQVHESKLISEMNELIGYLDTGDHTNIGSMIIKLDVHMDNMLALRADIGARTNRMELVSKKIASDNVSFTKLLSDAEDADMAEVIMLLKNAENVYNASLSVGAKVIQPSLVDFLR